MDRKQIKKNRWKTRENILQRTNYRLASSCPEFLAFIGQIAEDRKQITEKTKQITEGNLQGILHRSLMTENTVYYRGQITVYRTHYSI